MRILGIDPGEKRIGLAVSDPLGITAQALAVIDVDPQNPGSSIDQIAKTCAERQVEEIIVGYPLNMNGSSGPAAESAERFAASLRVKLGLPVSLVDERLTSKRAEQCLVEGGVRRKKRKGLSDKVAAVLLLQGYLDRKSGPWSANNYSPSGRK